ncbi:peptide deformylase [Bartonella bacilliformis str. Heidi Mejia]|uniref:Peptide deformylase n=2 Tax=Bartonella bacilliformis TaxID=774 RepID=DEF_BARBK|nr:peptide deformylase [Bartonella bacilliformis]A1UUB4.1 RecName: Full=Peptide deformylase; Short=PDF; AltName: Full=Polypeptide deformylase [Bartonella bacilliformis KC583]ABM44951.1 peptide deformylase [Bartonella bacilliformis KC583]AMG86284.1 peptide deformylase [Bartonella bacilliformis]EKS43198.1 peptide deformylase [Bartonella bacilliformis INS]EYS88915.1 peptide deformylase [Bartonella bacilliformis San Pedro600-02]EYS90876.1 peptide deformylase [Bartonella bacilliformis str. Heidi M
MPIKPLVILPDPILREISKPVEHIDSTIQQLADDMLETMYNAGGIGLAAIQVGIPLRMLVVDVSIFTSIFEPDAPQDPIIVINPEILWLSDERNICMEGCLSIPGYSAEVERPKRLCIRYRNREGEQKEIEADNILATCLQHEIDHLNGCLFIDHLSKVKRNMVIRKFEKRAKENNLEKEIL